MDPLRPRFVLFLLGHEPTKHPNNYGILGKFILELLQPVLLTQKSIEWDLVASSGDIADCR